MRIRSLKIAIESVIESATQEFPMWHSELRVLLCCHSCAVGVSVCCRYGKKNQPTNQTNKKTKQNRKKERENGRVGKRNKKYSSVGIDWTSPPKSSHGHLYLLFSKLQNCKQMNTN